MTEIAVIRPVFRLALYSAFTAVIYFILARASLALSFENTHASPLWPPSGFAFAALVYFGRRVIPGIFIGALSANLFEFIDRGTIALPTAILVSIIIGIGNTAEAMTGRYILHKMLPADRIKNFFKRSSSVFLFVGVAIVMSLVSATIGAAIIYLVDLVSSADIFIAWLTWWTGDVAGILVITPFLLIWLLDKRRIEFSVIKFIECLVLIVFVIFIAGMVFQIWFETTFFFTRAILIIPFLIWAAVRFDQRMVVSLLIITAIIAVNGTIHGQGPFVTESFNESLLTVQAFIAINSVVALLLSAAIDEQRQGGILQLERSNYQLAEAQRLAHIGSWEWDVKKNIVTWSDELYKIYGVSRNKFHPTYENFLSLLHPEDRVLFDEKVKLSFESGAPFDIYHRINTTDGRIRILHSRGEVIKDEAGKISRLSGTGQDVTEQKEAETLFRKASNELAEKNKELERSNRELASFTYVASHDLQEPLRKIQLFSDVLVNNEYHKLTPKGKNALERINAGAIHMKQLIEDLLAYSQVGTTKNYIEEVDLETLVNHVTTELKEMIARQNAVIEVDELPRIKVIPFQINQLLTNLIVNSLKFSRPGVRPHIRIKAEKLSKTQLPFAADTRHDQFWCISVSDNGIGFPEEYQSKIFEIFQRIHNRSEFEGKGIGLAICKKIVDNHGGFIRAEGKVNEGAVFRIYLPV